MRWFYCASCASLMKMMVSEGVKIMVGFALEVTSMPVAYSAGSRPKDPLVSNTRTSTCTPCVGPETGTSVSSLETNQQPRERRVYHSLFPITIRDHLVQIFHLLGRLVRLYRVRSLPCLHNQLLATAQKSAGWHSADPGTGAIYLAQASLGDRASLAASACISNLIVQLRNAT